MASVENDLNSESEISNPEAQERQADPPSPEDRTPNGGSVDQADAGATEPSTSPKKPKREYRSSDKVRASSPANLKEARKAYVFTPARRAASMKNLAKANAAPPEKRNRFTPRRLLAWYANLSLAHLKLGPAGKRAPTHIYNGTSCRHLEHSLALAGEDKAKLEAHRERFQRAFRPRNREERRFVRGGRHLAAAARLRGTLPLGAASGAVSPAAGHPLAPVREEDGVGGRRLDGAPPGE